MCIIPTSSLPTRPAVCTVSVSCLTKVSDGQTDTPVNHPDCESRRAHFFLSPNILLYKTSDLYNQQATWPNQPASLSQPINQLATRLRTQLAFYGLAHSPSVYCVSPEQRARQPLP